MCGGDGGKSTDCQCNQITVAHQGQRERHICCELSHALIHESVIALDMMKFNSRLKKNKSAACTLEDIMAPTLQMTNLPLQEIMARQNVALPLAKKHVLCWMWVTN